MDDQKIRKIVQEELRKSSQSSRFGMQAVQYHTHDGTNSPRVNQDSIVPAASIMGSITIDQVATYRINLKSNFTPQAIYTTAAVTGSASGTVRAQSVGSAQLTPTFYLEENLPSGQSVANTTIETLDFQFPFNRKPAQVSSFLWTTRSLSTGFFAGTSRDHIVSVFNGVSPGPEDDFARVTVTDFSKDFIILDVPILASGWNVFLNITIV